MRRPSGSTTSSPTAALRRRRRRSRRRPRSLSVWAVLAAAGRGERLGSDRPKAFAKLRDRPLLAESLERLEGADWIVEFVIVSLLGWVEAPSLDAEELGCA